MSVQTQAGLSSFLAVLAGVGLDIGYLQRFPAALERVTVRDIQAAAATYLAPRRLLTVLVGDADAITPQVEAFDDVEVRAGG
jgi:predicted Zn-dependent peptidase